MKILRHLYNMYAYKYIKFEPIIKWSGSKRHQVNDLIKHFLINIDTYYEPFIGGGSMMRALTETP